MTGPNQIGKIHGGDEDFGDGKGHYRQFVNT